MPVLWLQSEYKQLIVLQNETQYANFTANSTETENFESLSNYNYIFPMLLVIFFKENFNHFKLNLCIGFLTGFSPFRFSLF